MKTAEVQVFKPHLLLRLAVAAALLVWLVVMLLALSLPVGIGTELKALFFCAFFTVLLFHWWPMELVVEGNTLVYRGFLGPRRVPLADVEGVEILPIPLMTNYDVKAGGKHVAFSSFIAGHQRLLELIVERAHLAPQHH